MSSENEDRTSLDKAIESSGKMPSQSRISYTREFLLSFSELEAYKKLPSGFDESILGEFVDATSSIQDRQRAYGSSSLQGFRRTEHGSSPPTRGDMVTYSRGVYGRWDNRPSGRNDRDLDSQPDKDSDSGRRFGSQSRRSWQGPEHDGLLGSGSFPRSSDPKNHPNDQNQLNKSNEPYHPPRPYKAAPLSRRDATRDSFNDETFGSNEITSEDRAEEERRRRASFEFMRKEQQKAIQEKQKVNLNKNTIDSITETSELLNDVREEKIVSGNIESDSTATESFSSTDLRKSSLPLQTFRPLVPPGFTNFATEKDSGFKTLGRSDSVEVGKNEAEERLVQTSVQNGSTSVPKTSFSNGDQLFLSFLTKGEKNNVNSSSILDGSRKTSGIADPIVSEALQVSNSFGIVQLNSNLSGLSSDGEFNNNNKVLEKILGDALSDNDSSSTDMIEIRGDTRTLKAPHSSKFARWFGEEETNEISFSGPKDLLSLVVVGDDDNNNNNNKDVDQEISQSVRILPSTTSEWVHKSTIINNNNNNQEVVVEKVMTCEDLEQTILSEYTTGPHTEVGGGGGGKVITDAKSEKPRTDDHASHHLLSLLQKGPTTKENSAPTTKVHYALEKDHVSDESIEEEEGKKKNIQSSEKILTLESLFGTAFMKELQSVEAPVSIHRVGSIGSPREAAAAVENGGVFSSATDHVIRSEKTFSTPPNYRQRMKLDKTDKWLGFDDPLIDLEPETGEDEGLISAPNPGLNRQFSKMFPDDNFNQMESLVSSNGASNNIQIAKQLAAMKDARHQDRNNHGQTSTSNIQSMNHIMNIGKPLLQQQLDPHSAHIISARGGKFTGTENMIQHHDVTSNQQFPANMVRPSFHQHDHSARNLMMLQQLQMQKQMQMRSDYYPPHTVNDFRRGNLVLPQQGTGFIHEQSPLQGYPYGHGQPNIAHQGIPVAGRDVNGGRRHQPEAFQRLVEMELRANSKRNPPFSPWQ